MDTGYPIRAVAKLTGLSTDTLRAWEKRYRAVVPERSGRGRLYSPQQIDRLRLLGQLVQRGHAIGGIASLPDDALRNLLTEKQAPGLRSAEARRDKSTPVLTPVIAAIEEFDATLAADELARLAAVLRPRDVVYDIAMPLMREVGDRWHNGSLGVSQEHLTSQLLRNLMGSMMRLFRPSAPGTRMIFAAPSGQHHDFCLFSAAMLLTIGGAEPIFLGPDLPASEIVTAAAKTGARAVCLAVTVEDERTSAEVRQIDAALPPETELWMGGDACEKLDTAEFKHKPRIFRQLSEIEDYGRMWVEAKLTDSAVA